MIPATIERRTDNTICVYVEYARTLILAKPIVLVIHFCFSENAYNGRGDDLFVRSSSTTCRIRGAHASVQNCLKLSLVWTLRLAVRIYREHVAIVDRITVGFDDLYTHTHTYTRIVSYSFHCVHVQVYNATAAFWFTKFFVFVST